MSRSRIHMLTVAALRLEQERANPKLVSDLRTAAKAEAKRRTEGRDHHADEEKRISRQRTLMAMVPDSGAKGDLISAMAQRAYDLMWDGAGTECDAIVEFLPSALVDDMFNAWDSDTAPKSPEDLRSDFYKGEFHV